MKTVTLQPIATVTSAWSEFPADGLGHHLKVDEGVAAHDSATTYIYDTTGALTERLRFAALPNDFKSSVAVRLGVVAKSNDVNQALSFAFYIDGVEHVDGAAVVDFLVLPLDVWNTATFTLSSFPALTGDETIEVLLYQTGSSDMNLTAIQMEIDYLNHPDHRTASGVIVGPSATGAIVGPSVSAEIGVTTS